MADVTLKNCRVWVKDLKPGTLVRMSGEIWLVVGGESRASNIVRLSNGGMYADENAARSTEVEILPHGFIVELKNA